MSKIFWCQLSYVDGVSQSMTKFKLKIMDTIRSFEFTLLHLQT